MQPRPRTKIRDKHVNADSFKLLTNSTNSCNDCYTRLLVFLPPRYTRLSYLVCLFPTSPTDRTLNS